MKKTPSLQRTLRLATIVAALAVSMVALTVLSACDSGGGDTCDPACEAGFVCEGGTCVADCTCDPDQVCQDGQCVPADTACDPACAADEECVNGLCVSLPGCMPECGAGFVCLNGVCIEDGDDCDPPCQDGFTCQDGLCVEPQHECEPACEAGFTCQLGHCVEDCVPQCGDRECGDDGCGGECGPCPGGYVCNDLFACVSSVCQQECGERECGPDPACGQSCGECPGGYDCIDGACISSTCVPECGDRACGDDGCGGSCGGCPGDLTCNEDGTCPCLPACEGLVCGDDGCGGSCGACPDGEGCVDGLCVCQPACDGLECGDDGCGGTCGACEGQDACDEGQCVCQPACDGAVCGEDGCGGSCGDCEYGTCVEGACQCEPDCDGRVCGDDGCGGSCGDCGDGTSCNALGACISDTCVPECGDAVCGVDPVCGQSCGECPGANDECVDGVCECSPVCRGLECGDDGCGGSCGECGDGLHCVENACVCAPQCDGLQCGDDGCGGSCGDCGTGGTCLPSGVCSGGYPAGPYGRWVGSVIANLAFEQVSGHAVELGDFYRQGKAILITSAAGWCSVCQTEAQVFNDVYELYGDKGFDIVYTLYEDDQGAPIDAEFTQLWMDYFGLDYPVYMDPDFVLSPYYTEDATPLNMIVSTSDMRIRYLSMGYGEFELMSTIKGILFADASESCEGCGIGEGCSYTGQCAELGDCVDYSSCVDACGQGNLTCNAACDDVTSREGVEGYEGLIDCIIEHCAGVSDAEWEQCLLGTCGESYYGCFSRDETCGYVFGCYTHCEGDACGDCFVEGTYEAQQEASQLIQCIYGECGPNADPDGECWAGAVADGGACGEAFATCTATCVPQCEGKECGDSGCGYDCGPCGDGFVCNEDSFVCEVCAPQCDGLQCGADGCGGVCGECGDGFTCQSGVCEEFVCDLDGVEAVSESGSFQGQPGDFFANYLAADSASTPYDLFSFELYGGATYGGPTEPGTYVIEDENYADCGICVRGRLECGSTGACETGFLAYEGVLELTEVPGAVGDAFGGTFSNVKMREVTINSSYVSTPVPNGQHWCVEGISFLVNVQAAQ